MSCPRARPSARPRLYYIFAYGERMAIEPSLTTPTLPSLKAVVRRFAKVQGVGTDVQHCMRTRHVKAFERGGMMHWTVTRRRRISDVPTRFRCCSQRGASTVVFLVVDERLT